MKILGLSFGKKNANCDILCKEALYGAKEAFPDAEITFINTQRLHIDRCIGCGACAAICPQNIDIPAALAELTEALSRTPSWAELCRQREAAARKLKAKKED